MEISSRERRVTWVDTAKGIGIILVVIAHTSFDYTWAGKFINSFHIPLFFFLSGYFFAADKYKNFRSLASKKSATLLRPYFVFAALSYLFFLARYYFGDPAYYQDLNVYRQFFGIFYSAGTREWMDFNLPLWYLTCFFIVECLYFAVSKVFRKKRHMAAFLTVCSALGYADGVFNPVKLPWGVDVALTAVVFYGCGHLFRSFIPYLLSQPVFTKWVLAVSLLLMNLFLQPNTVNVNMKHHGYYFDFYLFAFTGIAACILFSSLIRSKLLIYMGRNALIIMALHIPLFHIVGTLVPSRIFHHLLIGEALLIVMTLLALIPASYVLNRYFPFILGKKSLHPPRLLQTVKRGVRL